MLKENLSFIGVCALVFAALLGLAYLFERTVCRDLQRRSRSRNISYVAMFSALGGVLMLLLNNPKRNPLINLGAGLWDLYNNLTGLLSDVLSYIRLFAIGLSGGVLALVFNTLASGFVPEGANIVVRLLIMIPILLIGHGINLFMSTISSFVHPLRLTFVEFFKNAGFEMAPRNFDPIRKMNDTNE